jgi:alkylhydroperoxidase family enzyme
MHGAVASLMLGTTETKEALDDWRTAAMPEVQRAMLDFLAKVTRCHRDLRPTDIEPLRASGISDEAIVDALHVAFAFNVITRMADALGWSMPDHAAVEQSARFLRDHGY